MGGGGREGGRHGRTKAMHGEMCNEADRKHKGGAFTHIQLTCLAGTPYWKHLSTSFNGITEPPTSTNFPLNSIQDTVCTDIADR